LGLSYANSRSMLQSIDEIPDRCGTWHTKRLSFRDRPDEHFIVHHRDAVEVIKALWGDPAFAEHLVYKPAKLFRGAEQTEEHCMFSEMWTGGFWNAAQVSGKIAAYHCLLTQFWTLQNLGCHSRRRNSLSCGNSL
jgi:hypothetical protein